MSDYTYLTPQADDTQHKLLYLIAVALGAGTGGISAALAAPTATTPTFVAIPASSSGNIPVTAKNWSFTLLTGTGTIGGVAAPLLIPVSGTTPTAPIPYTTGTTSTAFLSYSV